METNRNSNQVGGSGCVSSAVHRDVRSARAVQREAQRRRAAERAERAARGERVCECNFDACGFCREWNANH